jgi:peroxiredoxin Q/BCP
MLRSTITLAVSLCAALSGAFACAGEPPRIGAKAPTFTLDTDSGTKLALHSRQGKWTVLYFYPKDDTPGCTKQACAFRDHIELIRKQNAEVYGISTDDAKSHAAFRDKHRLNFPLLADLGGQVAKQYGADRVGGFSRRYTFIIGPGLEVRWIETDVDPALNAKQVAAQLAKLQKQP